MVKIMCPRCGNCENARILWGLPAYDEELIEQEQRGEVWLGGCNVPRDGAPVYHCNACERNFGAAKFQGVDLAREITRITYMDRAVSFPEMRVLTFNLTSHEVIHERHDLRTIGDVFDPPLDIEAREAHALAQTMIKRWFFSDWPDTMENVMGVIDGTRWRITVEWPSGSLEKSGENNYPPYWSRFERRMEGYRRMFFH